MVEDLLWERSLFLPAGEEVDEEEAEAGGSSVGCVGVMTSSAGIAPSILGNRSFFVFPFVGVLVCAWGTLIGVVDDTDCDAFVNIVVVAAVAVVDGEDDDDREDVGALGVDGGLDIEEEGDVAKPPVAISSSLDFLSVGFFRESTFVRVLLNLTKKMDLLVSIIGIYSIVPSSAF